MQDWSKIAHLLDIMFWSKIRSHRLVLDWKIHPWVCKNKVQLKLFSVFAKPSFSAFKQSTKLMEGSWETFGFVKHLMLAKSTLESIETGAKTAQIRVSVLRNNCKVILGKLVCKVSWFFCQHITPASVLDWLRPHHEHSSSHPWESW